MKTKTIKISEIAIDGGTQQREKIDVAIVAEYAEAMRCGAKFPAATVFFDGAQYWLVDGFHRYHAHRAAEINEIVCDVHEGTNRDAILFSFGVNATHGLRLNNADKRKAVTTLLMDKEWSGWSDREIAKHCSVGHQLVGKYRKENNGFSSIVSKTSQENNEIEKRKFTTSTGKTAERTITPAPVVAPESEYDPLANELQEARDTIEELAEQNTALRDSIALERLPEVEISDAYETITDLRAQVKTLEASLNAITSMRDSLMRENAEMKKQLMSQRNQIKKLGGNGHVRAA